MGPSSIRPNAALDEFTIIKTLGTGYHAEVKLAERNGQQFAIKKFRNVADLAAL